MNSRRLVVSCLIALAPMRAAAQTTEGGHAGPPLQASVEAGQNVGPMIVERVHSGWLIAPDFKITEVDRRTSELVGAYAGWITDDRFFIGGGGYWMANQSRDREMGYGGLVVQWLARTNDHIGFSAKGLVGGGASTLDRIVSVLDLPHDPRTLDLRAPSVRLRSHQTFFVAEPEADVLLRLTRHMRLTVGAGYRFVAAERGDDNRLRGAVGTVGLQIGGGS